MPKYNLPVQNVKYKPKDMEYRIETAFSRQEVEVAQEILGEESWGLDSAKQMFYRGPEGRFHLLNDRNPAEIQHHALSNSLYVVDKDGDLRQIGLEFGDDQIDITVSVPVEELALPPRPTFWTRVKAFFGNEAAKEQIRTYNETKEFNGHLEELVNNEKYGLKRNPDAASTQASQAEEVEKQQPEVKAPEVKAEPLNPSQMSPEQFYNHLAAMEEQGKDIKPLDVVMRGNPEMFYKSMEEMIRGQIAGDIKAKVDKITDSTEKDAFLNGQKRLYTSLAAGLGNFIAEAVDGERLNQMYADKSTGSLLATAMGLQKTGMEDYMKSIQAQNEVNKQAMEQSQPSAQVQMNHPEMQVQQPQPQPMGMGGPG